VAQHDVSLILSEIATLLPVQGPIEVFIHRNLLQPFEDLPFDVAIQRAADVYHARPYWPESRYQREYKIGRITDRDLDEALERPGDRDRPFSFWVTVLQLRRLALITAPQVDRYSQVEWLLSEEPSFDHEQYIGVLGASEQHRALFARDQAYLHDGTHTEFLADLSSRLKELFKGPRAIVLLRYLEEFEELRERSSPPPLEEISRKFLWLVTLNEAAKAVGDRQALHRMPTPTWKPTLRSSVATNQYLIKLAASFLDQGLGKWHLPGRSDGFFASTIDHLKRSKFSGPWWFKSVSSKELEFFRSEGSVAFIENELLRIGIPNNRIRDYLLDSVLEVRGWSGFMNLLESRADLLPLGPHSHDHALADFLAVKLLLERSTEDHVPADLPAPSSSAAPGPDDILFVTAFHMMSLCRAAGIGGSDILGLTPAKREVLTAVVLDLPQSQRLRIWHDAYEQHFRKRVYTALACHNEVQAAKPRAKTARFQLLFCIDDREESMRRYFEEFGEQFETFGTAGFFAIDAEYAPVNGQSAPFCPPVMTPTHCVHEVATEGSEKVVKFRTSAADLAHRLDDFIGDASRTAIRGWLVSLLGPIALLPWAAKTFIPRLAIATSRASDHLISSEMTELQFLTPGDSIRPAASTGGYTIAEAVERVQSVLRTIGLVEGFGRLVMIIGHGSLSRNNPYLSAYDCAACGGRPAKMNPRVFALMANMPAVRLGLREQGLNIPETTWFVGVFHNTTSDELTIFDQDAIPAEFRDDLATVLDAAQRVRGKNALERTRRFALSRAMSEKAAIHHVEFRTHNIAEPLPECGHATNGVCIVGRRWRTRGLFLDRRAFLVSYDNSIDRDVRILESILSAIIPVCMGINLDYFFSTIDNEVYGAGSKLPQNVTGLIGMMTGSTSDLRIGLPQQMVEIHEPVRLVMVIEAKQSDLKVLLDRNAMIRKIMFNRWIIVSTLDPDTGSLACLEANGEFRPFELDEEMLSNHPVIGASMDWVRGLDGPLPFASLQST
jgi:uncharacterized protein